MGGGTTSFLSTLPSPTPCTWHRAGIYCKLTDEWKDSASRESSWGSSTLLSLSTKMGSWLSPHGRGHLLREVSPCGDPEMSVLSSQGDMEADAFSVQSPLLPCKFTPL